ncbi:hypothetical protein BP422_11735 [Brevibacillus formosus]|uniref:Uncharacterized protein n=1 Tax=Brevibacillus formosus TaxID=54913 RepID=A0A220MH78_9BACL|nr:hypothetical protein BP422_11735 [Brevibacillus formosus]
MIMRCETLNEKPAFKQLFARKRCILPANSFYQFMWTKFAPLILSVEGSYCSYHLSKRMLYQKKLI